MGWEGKKDGEQLERDSSYVPLLFDSHDPGTRARVLCRRPCMYTVGTPSQRLRAQGHLAQRAYRWAPTRVGQGSWPGTDLLTYLGMQCATSKGRLTASDTEYERHQQPQLSTLPQYR